MSSSDALAAVADGFDVSPAALSGAAGVFDAESDALADIVATLTAELDSLGPCWGGDSVGARFGTAYQTAGLEVLDNVRALGVGMTRIAAAMRAVARSYEAIDQSFVPASPITAPTAPTSTTDDVIGVLAPTREARSVWSAVLRGTQP